MKISGLAKLTLLDFPGKTACTVFTSGCNFRCPFCHNASLVKGEGESISEADFFSFLESRRGLLDGVAVTGGEPLMHPEIEDFLKRVRELGFLIKIDTNGSYPDRLKRLVSQGLCDYAAMDIKSSPEGYARAAGANAPMEKIKESVQFLLSDNVDYEFRTTVARGAVLPEDFEEIGKWIKGAKRYFLQGFVDSGDILGENVGPYTPDEMKAFLETVRRYIPEAQLRGID